MALSHQPTLRTVLSSSPMKLLIVFMAGMSPRTWLSTSQCPFMKIHRRKFCSGTFSKTLVSFYFVDTVNCVTNFDSFLFALAAWEYPCNLSLIRHSGSCGIYLIYYLYLNLSLFFLSLFSFPACLITTIPTQCLVSSLNFLLIPLTEFVYVSCLKSFVEQIN